MERGAYEFASGQIIKAAELGNREAKERLEEIKKWNKEGKPSTFIDPPSFESFPKFVRAQEIIKERSVYNILDIGCFTGYFIRHMAREGYKCVGTDIQKELMNTMNYVCKGNPQFYYMNAEETKFEEDFDVVCLFDVLEHCLDDKKTIQKAEKVCDGLMIINLPRNAEYDDDSGEHLRNYTDADIKKLFGNKNNFKVEVLKDELGRPTSFITYEVERI